MIRVSSGPEIRLPRASPGGPSRDLALAPPRRSRLRQGPSPLRDVGPPGGASGARVERTVFTPAGPERRGRPVLGPPGLRRTVRLREAAWQEDLPPLPGAASVAACTTWLAAVSTFDHFRKRTVRKRPPWFHFDWQVPCKTTQQRIMRGNARHCFQGLHPIPAKQPVAPTAPCPLRSRYRGDHPACREQLEALLPGAPPKRERES